MTREELRAYVQSLVYAAPALTPGDADLLRPLLPMAGRRSAQHRLAQPEPRRTRRQPAA